MKLALFRSMWCAPTDLTRLVRSTAAAGFDGIEGPLPNTSTRRKQLRQLLDAHNLDFIAEVTTGLCPTTTHDWWVPKPDKTIDEHLTDLKNQASAAAEFGASFVTTMCGYDAWSYHQNLDFFTRAAELSETCGITISFETHRCRSLFNPWITRDILNAVPNFQLTCDFSHFCAVAERLITTEQPIVDLCATRAHHIHARVGYAQGAQVPDPRAPEYHRELSTHESWWNQIWRHHQQQQRTRTTMTVEWGDQGYLPRLPHTRTPVADLWQIITWMTRRQRQRFNQNTWKNVQTN